MTLALIYSRTEVFMGEKINKKGSKRYIKCAVYLPGSSTTGAGQSRKVSSIPAGRSSVQGKLILIEHISNISHFFEHPNQAQLGQNMSLLRVHFGACTYPQRACHLV